MMKYAGALLAVAVIFGTQQVEASASRVKRFSKGKDCEHNKDDGMPGTFKYVSATVPAGHAQAVHDESTGLCKACCTKKKAQPAPAPNTIAKPASPAAETAGILAGRETRGEALKPKVPASGAGAARSKTTVIGGTAGVLARSEARKQSPGNYKVQESRAGAAMRRQDPTVAKINTVKAQPTTQWQDVRSEELLKYDVSSAQRKNNDIWYKMTNYKGWYVVLKDGRFSWWNPATQKKQCTPPGWTTFVHTKTNTRYYLFDNTNTGCVNGTPTEQQTWEECTRNWHINGQTKTIYYVNKYYLKSGKPAPALPSRMFTPWHIYTPAIAAAAAAKRERGSSVSQPNLVSFARAPAGSSGYARRRRLLERLQGL